MDKLGLNLVQHLDSTAIIYVENRNTHKKILYKELLKEILKVSILLENVICEKSTVGIDCEKSPALISLTLGVLEAACSFSYLTEEDVLNNKSIKFILTEKQHQISKLKLVNSTSIFGKKIYLYQCHIPEESKFINCDANDLSRFCYSIKSSGSTGVKKNVYATFESIFSNIKALQKIFQLKKGDVVYSASPISFDVFLVDLFLSLFSGSALLIVPLHLRFDTMLFSKSTGFGATFLQITPTVFKQYGNEAIRTKILHPQSSLTYLVLGGEHFPSVKEVKTWQNWSDANRKRVFNIYGVTEMSCWSMIHEVTADDLEKEKIPLGNLLDPENDYNAFNPLYDEFEELILLTKSRFCLTEGKKLEKRIDELFEESHYIAVRTNDLVKRVDGKIFWHGRLNNVIKRFGTQVDLNKIEKITSELHDGIPVSCIYMKHRIALFYEADSDKEMEILKTSLNSNEYPDDIIRLKFLPTCPHGKVSKSKLKELYKEFLIKDRRNHDVEQIFLEAINQIFNLKLEKTQDNDSSDEPDGKRIKTNYDSSFNQLGGSSFDALRITMKIENLTNLTTNNLLVKLLDENQSIKNICDYLKKLQLKPVKMDISDNPMDSGMLIRKKYGLFKCVDSTPALLCIENQFYVAVGSHSGKIIVINAKTLFTVSQLKVDDRIESEITQFKNNGVVGCYNGFLYCFEILSGKIKWKFDSGAMIKSKCLLANDNFIIFGNYNYLRNLRCLAINGDNVNLKWEKLIGAAGIIANLLQITEQTFVVCTLDGTCERLHIEDGTCVWSKKFNYPIFSSPQRIGERDEFLVAEVMKTIHCLDFNGNELWKFDTQGHIFSSFIFKNVEDHQIEIFFGCHDKKLRCLNYSYSKGADLKWETELQSQIYGTPCFLKNDSYLISCSTNGHVNIINSSDGSILKCRQLDGEIFSSSKVFDETAFFGCRDNFLYCMKVE